MGRALAALLDQVPEGAARTAITPLLNPEATEHGPEAELRALIESAGIDLDLDAAFAAARDDGDLFLGDELAADTLQVATPRLVEAVAGGATGTRRYKAVVIRPGRAKGSGRRYYSPKMLEANAANFGGVTMFFNHEDMATIMQRGHGSRDPRDVCGWLQESTWWDPSYTEDDDGKEGRLPGAVMGHVDVLVEAADRVDALPQAFSLSICMDPTRVKVGRTDAGELAPCVEGIVPRSGSLDLITGEAGAGGKLLERLREAAATRYGSAHVDLSTIDDDRLVEAARARPAVLDALRQDPPPPPDPEEDVTDIDYGKLVEAVAAGEPDALKLIEAVAASPAITTLIEARVAARMDERDEEIRADARADNDRALLLRDMRDDAHRLIEAAGTARGGILTPAYLDDLRGRYELRNGSPSAALDVYDELGADGTVAKPALDRLREAVDADIKREQAKLREAAPTRVHYVAPPAPNTDGGGGGDENTTPEADPMAARLGMDSGKVREHQGVTP